jgi:hypothetical protein
VTRTFKPLIDKSVECFDADGRQTVFAIAPFGTFETRTERIVRLEAMGSLDPACATCQAEFYPAPDPALVFAPRHRASPHCRSGKRPHCTCPGCWG